MLTEFDSKYPRDEAYKRIVKHANAGRLEVVHTVKNEQIVLKGGRDYSTGWLVTFIVIGLLLFIVGLIIAAIYYWTRPYKKIVIQLETVMMGEVTSPFRPLTA